MRRLLRGRLTQPGSLDVGQLVHDPGDCRINRSMRLGIALAVQRFSEAWAIHNCFQTISASPLCMALRQTSRLVAIAYRDGCNGWGGFRRSFAVRQSLQLLCSFEQRAGVTE